MAAFNIFEGLKKSERDRVVGSGAIRPVDRAKPLFHKGDVGHEMYVVLTGKIHIVDLYGTEEKVLAELGPGEVFGEMAMFEKQHKRSASAVAKEPSQVLVISLEIMNKLLDKKMPEQFLTNIITTLCHRLRLTNSMYMRAKYGAYPTDNEQ
jgi:CRP/FNR family transcriptional regulator